MDDIGPIEKMLKDSPFADRAREIAQALKSVGVKTMSDLDNAPRKLTLGLYGYSVYDIVAFLREAAISNAIAESAPISKPAPRPKSKPKQEVVEVDVEAEAEAPDLEYKE